MPSHQVVKEVAQRGQVLQGLIGGWQIGTLFNARTGLPIDVEIARATIVYRNNTTGLTTTSPVVTGGVVQTTPVVNVPGVGSGAAKLGFVPTPIKVPERSFRPTSDSAHRPPTAYSVRRASTGSTAVTRRAGK